MSAMSCIHMATVDVKYVFESHDEVRCRSCLSFTWLRLISAMSCIHMAKVDISRVLHVANTETSGNEQVLPRVPVDSHEWALPLI